jgi:hypothetical protein
MRSTKGRWAGWVELGPGGLGAALARAWCGGDVVAGLALQDLARDAGVAWTCAMRFSVTAGRLRVRAAG